MTVTVTVTHSKVSGAGPASDPALIGGDDWDDEHVVVINGLGTAAELDAGTANGVATLDAGGKIPSSQIPAIALVNTFVVASQAAMLALSAQTGDVAVRSDENKSYILAGSDPATLGDWQELLTPGSGVTTFNGRSGAVTPQTGDYAQANITGLTTADSPQFAGLNVGHASDTTLTRSAAGIIAVEGVDQVNVSAAQTLTGKTLTSDRQTVQANSAGTSFSLSATTGNIQRCPTSGNATITLPADVIGAIIVVDVEYGGAHAVSWATTGGDTLEWAGGSAPAATSVSGKVDRYVFTCTEANVWRGVDGGRNF
ncbi:MAG: hypothetical protein AB7O63_09920 [Reyranellaceae bacterium]